MGPLDEKRLLQIALAYRAGYAHLEALDRRWMPRANELHKLDEFHRSRVAQENAYYYTELLGEYVKSALFAVIKGEPIHARPDPLLLKCRDRGIVRVLALIAAITHPEDDNVRQRSRRTQDTHASRRHQGRKGRAR